ncbi:ATP-binding protein [Pontixanthobacter aestiaquae]|uniref:histidine kinase n=1 Tax=Pontixanthobacter aestiaquae TaxID=1509367 RepID=A0A844Z895_9SPHN|nr:ATP-binding protein [Pontixanthobacter aestiaquae]MDN3645546.1 ATP-binding protein [Pontixanthobacter aestiaquae]MXO83456.1 two-component sensor histidine kinase [Pontixanthobacter aestiaquae]
MNRNGSLLWPGLALAVVTSLILVAYGVNLWLTLAVALVWSGSLFLIAITPPPDEIVKVDDPFSSDNMAKLVEYSGTPILVMEDTRVTVANRAARKLLGKHIVGQDMRVAMRHPKAIKLLESKKNGAAKIQGLVRRKDVWRINRQTLGKNVSVVELLNQTAETDVARSHTDFVANASHELRTPLASILGYVETIKDSDGSLPPEKTEKFLNVILGEGRRLQSLVSDLMSLSRIEAEKHDKPRENLQLAKLIERASKDAAGLERADRLEFDIEKDMSVLGDARQLEQLVRNLVDNALKYGDADGKVTISLSETDRAEAKISVSDTGAGIDPEHIPYLTKRFYRTDPGRSRAAGGTGLGLAIVKHIVERHLGRLDIVSELGQGTTISARIPAQNT